MERRLTEAEISDWAQTYIVAVQDPNHTKRGYPQWWAIEQFMSFLSRAGAEDCWLAILEVLSLRPPDEVLAVLAAGPLEDLIRHFGAEFIDRIELSARRDPSFRHLLGGVWEGGPPDIWSRVEKAQGHRW